MQKTFKGIITVLLAGSFWGTMCIFVDYLGGLGIQTMQTVFLRMLFTALFMLVVLLIYKPKLLKIKLKDLWVFLGNGLLSLLMFSFCYFNTISISGAATAAVLLYTAPIIVMVFSLFLFKEKITIQKIMACVLAVIGCAFVSGFIGSGANIPLKALLFGLGSGLGYALYSIFTRIAINKGYHALTVIFYSFSIGFIASVPLTDISAGIEVFKAHPTAILVAIVMGIITSVLPYLLYTYGLTCIESSRASIIASIEPVVAAIIGYFVLKQELNVFSIIGIVFVLSSLVILNLKFRKQGH